MIVTTDNDCAKLRLTPAEIAGLMGMQPGELHVHVKQVLDGERSIPSSVMEPLPPLERVNAETDPILSQEPQATEVSATDFRSDAPAAVLIAPPVVNPLGLPKPAVRLEDTAHGMTGNDINALAAAMRVGLIREADGRVTLVSALIGSHTFPDSNHAVAALRRGSFT
jgi:hypothetical protein